MQSDGCNALNGNTTKLIKEEVGSIDYSMLSTLFFFCDTVQLIKSEHFFLNQTAVRQTTVMMGWLVMMCLKKKLNK